MSKCQFSGCEAEAKRERLGTFKGQFNRDMALHGSVCEEHKPFLSSARFSYWICGTLAFLEEVEGTDERL